MKNTNNPNLAEEGKPYRWKKGESGNPSGRPKSKLISDAYRQRLGDMVPNDPQERTWAELIAEGQIRAAAKGKTPAAAEICDRTEGRSRQTVELSGPDRGPIPLNLEEVRARIKEFTERARARMAASGEK
jgi:hypothetical protein